ncbi:MAG: hypothetical protein GY733_24885, partial [bacterium]|nr:hypothetical protein [bacterium]
DSNSLDLNSRHAHVAPALDSAAPAPQQSRERVGAPPPPLALSSDGGLVDPQDEGVANSNANASAVGPGGEQREGAMGEMDEFDFGDLAVAGVIPRFSETKVVEAVPIALGDQALQLRVAPERKVSIEYPKIEAIAVAAVRGLGPKPVLLIDLLLNWTSMDDEGPLRVVRLKSTDFDPRSLVQGVEKPMLAVRALVVELVRRSGAMPLPGPEVLEGAAFEVFDALVAYEVELLQVAG